jgi:hypothetical protein
VPISKFSTRRSKRTSSEGKSEPLDAIRVEGFFLAVPELARFDHCNSEAHEAGEPVAGALVLSLDPLADFAEEQLAVRL